jgi:hypothetical protein
VSIWQSIDPCSPTQVRAIERTEASNYSGQGTESIWVDVAFTGHHPRLRLLVRADDEHLDVEVLLTPDAARLLADRLQRGAAESDRRHQH